MQLRIMTSFWSPINDEGCKRVLAIPAPSRRLAGVALLAVSVAVFGSEMRATADELFGAPAESHATVPSTQLSNAFAERRAACGVNALYLFLRLHGSDLEYSTLEKAVGLSPNGSTILALRNAAARFGVRSTVCSFDGPLTDLQHETMPVIVYKPQGYVQTQRGPLGHYYVVLGVNANDVLYLDATTGKRQVSPQQYFRRGLGDHAYVLARTEWCVPWATLALTSAIASGLTLVAFTVQSTWRGCRQ
jgi:hypothetical protein